MTRNKRERQLKKVWIQEVADTLREWAECDEEDQWNNDGLCARLIVRYGWRTDRVVTLLAPCWELFSGSQAFPVPLGPMDPRRAYGAIPKWEGKYGENRRDLCQFLAEVIEELAEDL